MVQAADDDKSKSDSTFVHKYCTVHPANITHKLIVICDKSWPLFLHFKDNECHSQSISSVEMCSSARSLRYAVRYITTHNYSVVMDAEGTG